MNKINVKKTVKNVISILEEIINLEADAFKKDEFHSFKVRPDYGSAKFYLTQIEGLMRAHFNV